MFYEREFEKIGQNGLNLFQNLWTTKVMILLLFFRWLKVIVCFYGVAYVIRVNLHYVIARMSTQISRDI